MEKRKTCNNNNDRLNLKHLQ